MASGLGVPPRRKGEDMTAMTEPNAGGMTNDQLNRQLAELLGFTVERNMNFQKAWNLMHPDMVKGGVIQLMRNPSPCFSIKEAWGVAPDFFTDANANRWAWARVLADERWLDVARRRGDAIIFPNCRIASSGGYWYAEIGPSGNPYAESATTSDACDDELEARALCLLVAFAVLDESCES